MDLSIVFIFSLLFSIKLLAKVIVKLCSKYIDFQSVTQKYAHKFKHIFKKNEKNSYLLDLSKIIFRHVFFALLSAAKASKFTYLGHSDAFAALRRAKKRLFNDDAKPLLQAFVALKPRLTCVYTLTVLQFCNVPPPSR